MAPPFSSALPDEGPRTTSTKATAAPRSAPVGLGLRRELLDELLAWIDARDPRLDAVAFVELAPENFMRRGGFMPAAVDRVRARFPILSHGLAMSLGSVEPFDEAYFTELRRYLRHVGAPFHSDHLSFSGAGGVALHDLLPLPLTRAARDHAIRRAREAADRLELPFAVENITHYFLPGAAAMPEADFIAEVVVASGAGLLLDVNNVFVNARNYGFDPRAFVAKLPLDRVVQIHVAGHTFDAGEGLLIDTHGADVIDPVLDLLAHVLSKTGPVPVLLERDHRIPELGALMGEIGRVAAACARGLGVGAEAHAV